ncbi:MAG: hypothetical protein HFE50_00670 [Clostridia bacterium]|nr:hypothetical protein [Clostridia bacterium]
MKFRAILNDEYDLNDEYREDFKFRPWHKTLIFFLVIWAVVNVLAVIYIKVGRQIYFWDNATYWDISRRIAGGAITDGGFWKNVYMSVAEQDYNYIAALPSAFLAKLFGESRLVYVLGLVNMYLLPSYVMVYMLAKKISKAPKIAAALTILLFPVMPFLAFNGFVDIGGLLICLICYNLYYTRDNRNDALWRYLLIGILLVAAMLWRRWYAFFAVSFITAMFADCVLFRRKWYKAAATAVTAGLILLICFFGFLTMRLLRDYGTLYAGYKFSVMTDFKLITRYFGLGLVAVLIVCSVVTGIKKKETKAVFMWVQIVVCLFMFIATQTHGQQHLLLYIPSLIMLVLIAIKHITKETMLIGITLLAVVHSVYVVIPRTQPHNIQEIKYMSLVPSFSMLPESRNDTKEILALKRKLDTTVYEGDSLGVLASSFTLNEDIIKNAEPSLGVKAIRPDYVVSLPQVDSRDKDLSPLYTVNYVLVASPAQTHLADGSQTVVTEAVRSFTEYTDIAMAYEEITGCRTVIDGIDVRLFHRIGEVRSADIKAFESRLYK